MNKKLILSDADGVLLDWEWAFSVWMQERGYTLTADNKKSYYLHHHYNELEEKDAKKVVRTFNESAAIGFLPALRDSTYYVKRLHEEYGYQFRVITSLSLDKDAQRLREMNLRKIFGDAIENVICLATGADKDEALEPYRDTGLWWIEDKPANADVGHAMGLKSILVEHGHNMHHKCSYPVVKNWKEIYERIVNES
jgi:beta-phosphoglucomutase-like phosphatase (HAD superfamily)